MLQHAIPVFRVFGITIKIHASWLIIFVLITWSLALGYFPGKYPAWSAELRWTISVITSLLFFLSILLHELAHSIIAKLQGINVKDIVLFVFGGVSEITEEPVSAQREFVMALAGPATSFVIGVISYGLYLAFANVSVPTAATLQYLAAINILLGVFNLVPGFPLDGGRVFRAIVWGITGNLQKATRWAARSGVLISYALILLGIWAFFTSDPIGGIWLVFIGWFLNSAANSTRTHAVLKHFLAGHGVRELVEKDTEMVPSDMTLDMLVHEHFLGRGKRNIAVMDNGSVVGLVTVRNVRQFPSETWPNVTAAHAMTPIGKVIAVTPDADLWSVFQMMSERDAEQIAVVENGHLSGMLARESVINFIKLRAELEG